MDRNKSLPPALLPAACLPSIEYFCWLYHSEELVIEIYETYPKQTCRNRYTIESSAGKIHLSVPVVKPNGNHTLTKDVHIDSGQAWNRTHWRTLESAYNKSPYFRYYAEDFSDIIMHPPELLVDLNLTLIRLCCRLMNFEPVLKMTTGFEAQPSIVDLRHKFSEKKKPEHEWQIKDYIPYIQVFSDRHKFISNLSILDLLFNEGPESVSYLHKHAPAKE